MLILAFVSLALLCSGTGLSEDFLPGSCARAGFTGCCTNSSCAGEPASCFCDITCYDFDDCCSDMELLCPPPLDQELPNPPLYPMAMEVTFHTARIYWTTLPNSTNETYSIEYLAESTDDDLPTTIVHLKEATACDDSLPKSPCLMLTSLQSGTTYHYAVLATNVVGTQESKEASFTTMQYAPVQQVRAAVLNPGVVRVTWTALWVPEGTAVLHYFVLSSDEGGSTSRWKFSGHEVTGSVGELNSAKVYEFRVVAHIQDADGSIIHSPPSTVTLNSTVFVPEMALFQLRGGPLTPCTDWNDKTEGDISETFHSTLLGGLREACGCDYVKGGITSEQLLCMPTSDVIYRANIASTTNYSVGELLDFIEGWVETAPELSVKQPGGSTVSLDPQCPVRIARRSEPVCQTEEKPPKPKPCDCEEETKTPVAIIDGESQSSSDSEPCVAIGLLVVSLVAELLLLLVLLMVGVIVVLWWKRRSTKIDLEHVLSMGSPSEPNIYVHQLDPVSHTSDDPGSQVDPVSHTRGSPSSQEDPVLRTSDNPDTASATEESYT